MYTGNAPVPARAKTLLDTPFHDTSRHVSPRDAASRFWTRFGCPQVPENGLTEAQNSAQVGSGTPWHVEHAETRKNGATPTRNAKIRGPPRFEIGVISVLFRT